MMSAAVAQAQIRRADTSDLSSQIASISTGEQLTVEGYNGDLILSGHSVNLKEFSGVIGFSSETLYLLTIAGEARVGEAIADSGHMLLIPPYGRDVTRLRFDARRLHKAVASSEASMPALLASLDKVADGQERKIFFGLLARTEFNVATMGSASDEVDRRSRIGGTAIRQIRFASQDAAAEEKIVTRFLVALIDRDAQVVSQFLDPLPYGYGSLPNGGDQARLAMAQSLIAEQDWSVFRNAVSDQDEANKTTWIVKAGGKEAVVKLRPTTEFAFVQSIEVRK